jgi:hypothetical protein
MSLNLRKLNNLICQFAIRYRLNKKIDFSKVFSFSKMIAVLDFHTPLNQLRHAHLISRSLGIERKLKK